MMNKDDYEKIWEEIFAKHRALVRMKTAEHEELSPIFVCEEDCDCITTVLQQNGYNIKVTNVFGGVNPQTLNSEWKRRILNFGKDGEDELRYVAGRGGIA